MRRASLLGLGLAAWAAFLACASDDATAVTPPATTSDEGGVNVITANVDGGGSDAATATVPPGDVCGDPGGVQANAVWPMAGLCRTRAGRSPQAGPLSTTVREITSLGGGAGGPAIGADGTLWIAAADGTVFHVTSSGGAILHQGTLGGPVNATPAIDASGHVIIACEDGFLYGLDTAPTGDDAAIPTPNVTFKLQIGVTDASPVIAADGTIYIGTQDGNLVAVASDGASVKWKKPTGDTLGSSPAIGQDGAIYVGSTDHSLRAFATDGSVQWSLDLGAEMHGSPAIGGDGTIYVGTADGKLHAVTPQGSAKWAYTGGGDAFVGTPAIYAGQVLAANLDKHIHAVSTLDGSSLWTYATDGTPTSPLIDSDQRAEFASDDGHFYIVTPKGSLYFAGTAKGPVRSTLALGAEGLFGVAESGLDVMGP